MALSKSKTVVFLVFIVAFTILFGAGCKSDKTQATPSEPEQGTEEAQTRADAGQKGEAEAEAESEVGARADSGVSKPDSGMPAPDAGADASVIPEGWQIYRNEEWGIERLAYPEGWYWREETVEETRDPNKLWVDFNSELIAALPESDPVYPLSLIVNTSTLEDAMAEYFIEGVESQEEVIVGGRQYTKLTYRSDLVDNRRFATFLLVQGDRVYEVIAPEDLPEITTFLANLTVGG